MKHLALKIEKTGNRKLKHNNQKSSFTVMKVWVDFLTKKFGATHDEKFHKPPMETLPVTRQGEDELMTDKEILQGLANMINGKACGQDNIPAEVYKHNDLCNKLLRDLLKKIWRDEEVSVVFARATFIMLFKNKGSHDDPSKYRCIGLLNHSYTICESCTPNLTA